MVEAVGSNVTDFEPGDEIYGTTGLRRGAYGQFVALPGKAVIAPKPATMTFAEAAALPLGGVNGLDFMRRAKVGPGDRVLITGAGGVIGAYGVQVATTLGAEVTGVDAAHKEAFVRSQGAEHFIDYRQQDVTALDQQFDVIFDMVPSNDVSSMLDLLVDGGRYAHGNPRLMTMLRARRSRSDGKRMITSPADETRDILRELAAMADAGEIKPIVDQVLPMDEAAEAHRLVDTEERIGAIVLAIGDHADGITAS